MLSRERELASVPFEVASTCARKEGEQDYEHDTKGGRAEEKEVEDSFGGIAQDNDNSGDFLRHASESDNKDEGNGNGDGFGALAGEVGSAAETLEVAATSTRNEKQQEVWEEGNWGERGKEAEDSFGGIVQEDDNFGDFPRHVSESDSKDEVKGDDNSFGALAGTGGWTPTTLEKREEEGKGDGCILNPKP